MLIRIFSILTAGLTVISATGFPQIVHAEPSLAVVNLRCENAIRPLGVDAPAPRLSWELESKVRGQRQTAWQILAAASADALANSVADLWDSGWVTNSETTGIVYQGQPLKSSQPVFWKVRVKDRVGNISKWSQSAHWEMGLLSPADWQAQWLNDGKMNPTKDEDFYQEDPAPLFRKPFFISKKIARARLYISGLGYYETTLNGSRAGDAVLDPGWTAYGQRVLYNTYDVSTQLQPGTNCLGVTLGNGWYNPLPLRMWGNLNLRKNLAVGRPRFIARLQLDFADGTQQTVVSDSSWKTTEGPIRFNSIYLGEIYDARKEIAGWDKPKFDDSDWRKPAVATESSGALRSQAQPPIRITKKIRTVKLTEPVPGTYIFDLGQNFSGWANLQFSAPAGTQIKLRYGELLNTDGTLNPMTSVAGQIKKSGVGGPGAPPVAWQGDTYIARGGGEESYTPRFTFHAFRYVEVTGLPRKPSRYAITGLRLNSDVERVGSFACSDELFNRIQEMCDWTFLSNIFSVQSDCPHRERFGYGGDLAVTSEAFMMNYDMADFYAKVVRDWGDGVRTNGDLTDTAPFVGIQYCGLVWGMAHPLVLRQLHQYYGNRQLVAEQYATAKSWLEFHAAKNPDGILTNGLSDHESLAPVKHQPALLTPLYADSARIVGELAAILGHQADAEKYQRLAADIQQAYLKKYLNPATGEIGSGTQAEQSFALYLNLVPAPQRAVVTKFLLDKIGSPDEAHLSTGIFGTKFLLDVLTREGHVDLAAAIVGQKTFPGWGFMLENGATTLWEHWKGSDNTFSHNHPMFGSVSQWFYQWLGGIQPAPDAVGFDRIVIRPQMPKNLDWVRCSYHSVHGLIVSNWQRKGAQLKIDVTIPPNTTATVYVPAKDAAAVTESGQPAAQADGVKFLRQESGVAIFSVGSGEYHFRSTP